MSSVIMLSCPNCFGLEWSQINLEEYKYQCKECGEWTSEEELTVEIMEKEVE